MLHDYVVITTDNEEYIIEAANDMEAAYRAESLVGLRDKELKDVKPL